MADVTVTAADVLSVSSAVTATGTAGGTITAGQSLYKDSTDSDHLKAADNDASEATAQCVGISLHGASDGQPLKYQSGGVIDIGGTVVVGTAYYVSATAGGIAPVGDLVSTDYVTLIGHGVATNNIKLNIDITGVQVP